MSVPATINWIGQSDGKLVLLDQTRLPGEIQFVNCTTVADLWEAIRELRVRGAPAIGIAAAYGVCLAAKSGELEPVEQACDYLATSRPTAVNLFWALERMRRVARETASHARAERLLDEARAIHEEDRRQCTEIGRHGANLLADLPTGAGVLTHCNAGALATGGDGTALAVIFELARRGKRPRVYVDETRPLLQGARLTAWELVQRNVEATLICDSMAAQVMKEGRVAAVITGADRIAANGDTANKIGTYGLAVLARAHHIPFYVAAPSTTLDLSIVSGMNIPIEVRGADEIVRPNGCAIAPAGVAVYNPAFDVTPAEFITAIVTESGIFRPGDMECVSKTE
jgi:methylthioribose-1-phosphate isomerase